jgi:hypothetical protein
VNLIAREVVHRRWTPEEVLIAHAHLTLPQVHAALAYYFDHRDEVEASIKHGDALEHELRTKFPSRLRERLNSQLH